MEKRYVKFQRDYPHLGPRKKDDVAEVNISDAQMAAWEEAKVAKPASDDDIKKAEAARKAAETRDAKEDAK